MASASRSRRPPPNSSDSSDARRDLQRLRPRPSGCPAEAMFSAELMREGEALLARCRELGLKLCTAESCTGGLVSALLTEFAGSSDVVERGFVTYSNAAKETQLSVPAGLLATFGAVSEEVARAMAEGGLSASPADVAIA